MENQNEFELSKNHPENNSNHKYSEEYYLNNSSLFSAQIDPNLFYRTIHINLNINLFAEIT